MKSKLKEYIPQTEKQRQKIWENGIFVLDANVLLNMCRYSKQSCDELLAIVKTHKDNLWLPYQVGMEFFNNRLAVIEGVKNGFNQLLANISKIDDAFSRELKFNDFRNDTAHNLDQLRADIKRFRKNEETKIKKWQKEYEDSDKEAILNEILDLYDGKVGDDYDEAKLEKIYKEGEKRYKENVPPGYADLKEKEKKGNRHLYGDLIWWKQVIDYARDKKRNLVIVTDDKKEDWWYKLSGKTISPRVELIREFDKETKGQYFLMYKTHQFMEMAKQLDGATVSDTSIKEVEETGALSYRQLLGKYHIDPDQTRDPLFSKYMVGRYNGITDSPVKANTYLSDPYGVQAFQEIRGMTDGKIFGVYDPSSYVALPIADSATGIKDYLAQHPDVSMAFPHASEETQKWLDYLSKKDK